MQQSATPAAKLAERRFAVCACDEKRERCPTCGQGYLEELERGNQPRFKTIQLPTKRVPCCRCEKPLGKCPDCKEGYVEMTEAGKVPRFMVQVIEEDPEGKDTGAEKKEDGSKDKQPEARNRSPARQSRLSCHCHFFL